MESYKGTLAKKGDFDKRRPGWLVLALLGGVLAGCQAEAPPAPPATWTNPQTGVVVQLPDGWRSSQALAKKGQTTVGYFKPKPRKVLAAAYTHVTLHREAQAEVGLDEFVENFTKAMAAWRGETGEPAKSQKDGLDIVDIEAVVPHDKGPQRLVARIWTADEREYWYSITEAPQEDTLTVIQAQELITRLQNSTQAAQPKAP